jgi:signal transduction histidine kinase/ActR/RegA family two-component response regulator
VPVPSQQPRDGEPSELLSRIHVEEAESAEARVHRDHRFQTRTVPALRTAGMLAVTPLVALHEWSVESLHGGPADAWSYLAVAAVYAALSTVVLRWLYGRTGRWHLGDLFLGLDLLVLAYAVHLTGGDQSLLSALPFVRVADQVATSFRRCFVFLQLATATSIGSALVTAGLEGRELDLGRCAVIVLAAYVVFSYVAVTARTAERIRARLRAAMQLARESIRGERDRSRELAESVGVAEAANRAKSEFLANVSHDLRTPLVGILGATELARGQSRDAGVDELLETVQVSGRHLLRLLNDLLDLSKLEAGKLQLDRVPFALEPQLAAALRSLEPAARAKGLDWLVRIGPEVPATVLGDPLRLAQILGNLLGNALKFTDRGHVTLEVDAPAPGRLRLAVRDSGVGIAPEQLERIFDRFVQADGSASRRSGGTGLGLSLVRSLAAAMDGTVAVHSVPGSGSVFTVDLALPAETAGPPPLAGARLALHCDEPRRRDAVAFTLRSAGAQLVENGEPVDLRLWDGVPDRTAAADDPAPLVVVTPVGTGLGDLSTPKGALRLPAPALPREIAAALAVLRARPAVEGPTVEGPTVEGPAALRPSAPTPVASRALRLLLAEDHPLNRRLAIAQLTRLGHRVVAAEDGERAVECFAAEPFDAVLMDIQMPNLDGIEATRRIRALEAPGQRVPIIAVTANALESDARLCFEAGMDAHLSKPVDFPALMQLLDRRSWEQRAEPGAR